MRSFFCLTVLLLAHTARAQQVILDAGGIDRFNLPVQVNLKKPSSKASYGLYNPATKHIYPLQWEDSAHALFILSDSLRKDTGLILYLKKIGRPKDALALEKDSAGIEVLVEGKPVLRYHHTIARPPADSPAIYQRSGFIHPLYTPAGTVLTDDFPSNHAHQHGIFHAWTNTTFRKQHVDFWNQHQKTGTVRHVKMTGEHVGPVFARLSSQLEYVSLANGPVLQEEWTITVYPFREYFLYDLELVQKNTSTDTLYLNEYLYGGMAFRGSKRWDPFNKQAYQDPWHVLTSEGYRDSMANHTHARWVTAYGPVDGRMSAATVFNHPADFRYPQKIRVHPQMPYWVYTPVADGPFNIPPGGEYRARYRYFINNSEPDPSLLQWLHENWIKPVAVAYSTKK